jgi:hypothetical protein
LSRIREDAEASLREMMAAALEANARLARLAEELREENARLRAENAAQAADLAVLQRMVSGGRRSDCGRSRRRTAAGRRIRAGSAGAARAGNAARGRERGGGITRTCPGSR